MDQVDQAILFALDENQFGPVRQLSRLIHIPSTPIYRCLMQSLGFTVRRLRCAADVLSQAQNAQRVGLSRRLLQMLEVQHDRA
jgi:hypothetical protein